MIMIQNLKLVLLLEYQNIKKIFAKGYVPNWSEEVFLIKKVKNTVPGHMLLVILTEKKLVFTKKNCKKQIKRSLELKK